MASWIRFKLYSWVDDAAYVNGEESEDWSLRDAFRDQEAGIRECQVKYIETETRGHL